MAKKEKSDLIKIEEVLKKFKTFFPDKFIMLNDSIAITEIQTSTNTGDCSGVCLAFISDDYKLAFRHLFYNNEIDSPKLIHINTMAGIREIIDSHKESEETFYDDLWKSDCISVMSGNDYDINYDRIVNETKRIEDKQKFVNFDFLEDEDTMKVFLDDKNSILLNPTDNKMTSPVIIDSSLISFITVKNIDKVEYFTGIENTTDNSKVGFVVFHLNIDIIDTYSTYHYIGLI